MLNVLLAGEIIQITNEGVKHVAMVARPNPLSSPSFCIFEYVYFARPDSMFEGICFVAIVSYGYSSQDDGLR